VIFQILLVIIGFALLIKGADFLVDGASGIAKKFHIPEIIIGLTIVSIGTSMPELVVSTKAGLEGLSDIAIGNVVGSNIANLFFILGICAMIHPLKFKKQTRLIENPIVIISTLLLFVFANLPLGENSVIARGEGIILIILFAGFLLYNIIMVKKAKKFDNEEEEPIIEITREKENSLLKSVINVIVGIVALKFGGDFVVDGSVTIAEAMGISEKLISLTIIAFSTSLPELITSVVASIKGKNDIAIGNVVGSQIFNILLILGVTSILSPITYSLEYNFDMIVLLVGSLIFTIIPFVGKRNQMTRKTGIVFVLVYILYIARLVIVNT